MIFQLECRYLGGANFISAEKTTRFCIHHKKSIETCDGCEHFQHLKALCTECGIFGYCDKTSKLMPAPAPFANKPRTPIVPKTLQPLDNPQRHMLYHIYPTQNGSWQWNVDYLKAYIELFDGVRSVGVVTDGSTASLQEVQDYFGESRIDNWIHFPNDPIRREGVTFVKLMNTLPRDSGVTWYGHAKGVRHEAHTVRVPEIWASVMYQLTLGKLEENLKLLQTKPVVGNFARYNDFNLPKHECWHYSGTYFWFRNDEAFLREWSDIAPNFFACIEAWPSRIFAPEEAGVLFGDNAGNLYDLSTWQQYHNKLVELGIHIDLSVQS